MCYYVIVLFFGLFFTVLLSRVLFRRDTVKTVGQKLGHSRESVYLK